MWYKDAGVTALSQFLRRIIIQGARELDIYVDASTKAGFVYQWDVLIY